MLSVMYTEYSIFPLRMHLHIQIQILALVTFIGLLFAVASHRVLPQFASCVSFIFTFLALIALFFNAYRHNIAYMPIWWQYSMCSSTFHIDLTFPRFNNHTECIVSVYFQPKENFLQFYRRIMWLIFDVTFWCDLASGHSGSRLWYFNRVRGLWSHCRTCSSMWLWYTAQYICPSNLVQYICSSMCYNTLHNTSVLCSSTLHALGPGLEGGLPSSYLLSRALTITGSRENMNCSSSFQVWCWTRRSNINSFQSLLTLVALNGPHLHR